MINNIISFIALNFLIISCVVKDEVSIVPEHSNLNFESYCIGEPEIRNGRRIYGETSESDEIGVVRRYEFYKTQNSEICKRGQIPLSRFEQGIRRRAEKNIKCVPQTELTSEVYLKSSNNYYHYRNDNYYLHLDPSTGAFRRIILGEDKNGNPAHMKEIGCFWTRQDYESEIWGPQDYGLQILIDQSNAATSNNTKSLEIYKITNNDTDWTFLSLNETQTWDESFCPFGSTPWGFCDFLRNGNILFAPKGLTLSQKNDLLKQAVLIRSYYVFSEIRQNEFHISWTKALTYEGEMAEVDFKYKITFGQDVPLNTINARVDYIKDLRPMMPEKGTSDQKLYCYDGFREVPLDDGTKSYIWGEICFEDGNYSFTQT